MFWRVRSFWLAAGAVAYVAFAALVGQDAPSTFPSPPSTVLGRDLPWIALVALPAALAVVWTHTTPPSRGEDRVEEGARAAARACFAGAAVVLAALTGRAGPGLTAFANLGAAVSSMAALVALARIGSLGGLVAPPPSARRLDAAAFASLLWTVAVALPTARALGPRRAAELDPVLIDYATVTASLGSLGLAIASAYRVLARRRLELGVADRAASALVLGATAVAVGVIGSLSSISTPERILPLCLVAASCAVAASVTAPDPTLLGRAARTAAALALLAAPVALVAAAVTQQAPARAGAVVFAACGACAIAGLASPRLARRLGPLGSRWLGALEAATGAAMSPDPDAALEAALLALGAAGGRGAALPSLFRMTPPEEVTVDRAGYAHVTKAEVPEGLLAVADAEPEAILRVEAARALEVRRPDLRPLVAWLDQRGVAAIAVVRDELSPVALLAVPRGARTAPATLEEVRALRALADRLGAVIAVSASLSRSRAREIEARGEVERLAGEARRLEAARDRDAGRMLATARMLERPARVAAYSPGARAAMEQLERLGEALGPVTLLSAPGVDAIAWAAVAHLASSRRAGPLVVVDGTSAAEHDLSRWRDAEGSPLAAAAGGTLVLADAHALPAEVQGYVAAGIGGETILVVSLPATVDALVAAGKMNERLADLLGDRAVAIPPLAARAEDLRALAMEHLARIAVRLGGRPLGLAPRALAALLDHDWPGNDEELHATLLKAALVTEGEVVGPRELAKAGIRQGDRPGGP